MTGNLPGRRVRRQGTEAKNQLCKRAPPEDSGKVSSVSSWDAESGDGAAGDTGSAGPPLALCRAGPSGETPHTEAV